MGNDYSATQSALPGVSRLIGQAALVLPVIVACLWAMEIQNLFGIVVFNERFLPLLLACALVGCFVKLRTAKSMRTTTFLVRRGVWRSCRSFLATPKNGYAFIIPPAVLIHTVIFACWPPGRAGPAASADALAVGYLSAPNQPSFAALWQALLSTGITAMNILILNAIAGIVIVRTATWKIH